MDTREIALNELNVACRETADHFEYAAGLLEDTGLRELFERLGRRRRETARILDRFILEIGLPKRPDPEKEGLEHLVTRLRASLSADRGMALVHERAAGERDLAARITGALQEDLPAETRAFLENFLNEVMETQRDLAAAARTHSSES